MTDEAEKPFMTFEELRVEDISKVWHGMDLDTMGRVLRAHLVVEHFMNELLAVEGFDLPRLKKGGVWVKFSNKQKLLGKRGPMALLWKGVDQLNAIRNDFAHDPAHLLTVSQTAGFYDEGGHFQNYLTPYCAARSITSPTPIQVVEAFAESAAALFLTTARILAKAHATQKAFDEERFKLEGKEEILAALDSVQDDEPPPSEP